MDKALVTVVLPIYNVEKYLDRCINSVVNQSYTNLEILLIDDGSPDNCPSICDSWADKDSRIRVIHKENQGLGMARNTGIDNANGKYICFFDSDDYIDKCTIEKAVTILDKDNSDIIVFGINFVDNDNNVTNSYPPATDCFLYKGEAVLNDFFVKYIAPTVNKKGRTFYMSPCLMLYSLELIKKINWHFVSEREIISEDVFSQLLLFKYVNSVSVLPEALYYYCNNGASLSRKYLPDRYDKIKHFYLESLKVCEKLEYSDTIKHCIAKPYLGFTVSALKQEVAFGNKKYRKQNIEQILNDELLIEVLKQNKKDSFSIYKRIIYWSMRNKFNFFTLFLIRLKLLAER